MFLFVLAVLGITAIVDFAAIAAMVIPRTGAATPQQLIGLSVVVSGAVLLMIAGVSIVKTLMLRQAAGSRLPRASVRVPVPDMPTDPQLRRYRNIVEEIAIASSTPVPVLYYLPQEAGINAFAAGYTPADAAVCVTQGSLDRLNRDELQGVIAHEFSHIVNGDMRLSIRLIGVLAGITALAVIGRTRVCISAWPRPRQRQRSACAVAAVGLVVLAAGWIGVFFGRLIKAAVSRQREYLADASAVQFTRQTSGLTGALKKIGGLEAGSRLRSPKTENVSHMLFGEGVMQVLLCAVRNPPAAHQAHPGARARLHPQQPRPAAARLALSAAERLGRGLPDGLRRRWGTQAPASCPDASSMPANTQRP